MAFNRNILRFTIKDYGKGINPASFSKIFEPFSQESVDTGSVYGGTGLGLAITAKLIDRLGGRIYVQSKEHCYAKFTVDFPLEEPPVDPTSIVQSLQDTVK